MKIVFIRHSHSQIDPDTPNPLWSLSQKGVDLMDEKFLGQLPQDIQVVYSSYQLKAIHTAVKTAEYFHVPLNINADLTELSSLTNSWKEDHEQFVHDIYTGVIERWEDGESLEEAKERFNKAVSEICVNESGQNMIAIVSHGNVLALFSEQYDLRNAQEIQSLLKMPDFAVFDWENKKFDKSF